MTKIDATSDVYKQELINSMRLSATTGAYVGKLWYSKRRWSWAIRFDSTARDLDKGARWEPTEAL
jgi:hypothetical protein